jgi:multiple sugar transport system ATP-binding protein
VAIGRAIVRKPEVFLFDEPLSNLDAALRAQTRVELARLHRELATHHDLRDPRPGRGDDAGPEDRGVQRRPHRAGRHAARTVRAAGQPVRGRLPRLAAHELFAASLVGEEGAIATVRLAGGALAEVAADAGTRRGRAGDPGRASRAPAMLRDRRSHKPGIPGTVALVEYLGDVTLAYVQVEGVPELVAVKCHSAALAPPAGTRVLLAFDPAQAYLFGADGAAMPARARSGAASVASC